MTATGRLFSALNLAVWYLLNSIQFIYQGHFTIQRCTVRSLLVLFILGLAEGIPKFGLFLNLVGSSSTVLLTFVFPCLFYLKLERNLSLHMKVFLIEILVVGVIAGVASTYFAIKAIIDELS